MLANPHNLQEAERIARELFLENPSLSIDSAARELARRCRYGLNKDRLSAIRRSVQSSVTVAPPTEAVQPKRWVAREPFNPPKIKEVAVETTAEEVAAAGSSKPISAPPSTRNDRVSFLNEWVEKNPLATVEAARKAVLERFGISLGTTYIAETLRVARHIYEEDRGPESVAPRRGLRQEDIVRDIHDLVRAMKRLGVKSISIENDGNFHAEVQGKLD